MFGSLVDNWLPVAILVGLALAYYVAQRWLRDDSPTCEKRASLLSPVELSFFRVLRDAVGGDWAIWSLVNLGDLIQVHTNAPGHQTWQNRLQAKRIHFVLCDLESMQARLAIELTEPPAEPGVPAATDDVIERALAAAALPLLRVPTTDAFEKTGLRKSIEAQLAASGRRA